MNVDSVAGFYSWMTTAIHREPARCCTGVLARSKAMQGQSERMNDLRPAPENTSLLFIVYLLRRTSCQQVEGGAPPKTGYRAIFFISCQHHHSGYIWLGCCLLTFFGLHARSHLRTTATFSRFLISYAVGPCWDMPAYATQAVPRASGAATRVSGISSMPPRRRK